MPDARAELIGIYARYGADGVGNSGEYRELCEQNGDDRTFLELRSRLDNVKRDLERDLGGLDHQGQVRMALKLLKRHTRVRKPEDRRRLLEEYRSLVVESYAHAWTPAQRAHLERGCEALKPGGDYFLSFTNRNATPANDNVVNRNHWYFIKDVLGPTAFRRADTINRNLVAEVVQNLLRNGQLDGFYYPEHEQDNSVVHKKLRDACVRALAFVQLIQNLMFTAYPSYCYFEYQEVKHRTDKNEMGEEQIVFALAEPEQDLIPREGIFIDFDGWYTHIASKDIVKITPTRSYDPNAIRENRESINRQVVKRVREAWDRFLDNVPV